MHDIVIRNGNVVDGTGLARYRADVGIKDGRIAAIGRIRERGHREIDAEGHVVTPGFIDGHTHMDAQLFWDPLGTCSCWHGVTSVVMGNCGFSLAPASAEQRPLVIRNLERAEDISGAAMQAAIEWRWSSFREYLDVVDTLPKGINYAANIGHSALRTYIMGERAFEQEAGDDDLRGMKAELRDALAAGAIGLSSSRSSAHLTSDDRPVASRQANWDEVRTLVGVMGQSGRGIFELANEAALRSGDKERTDEYLQRLQALAVESGVPITFGIQAANGMNEVLEILDSTAAAGGRMFGQSHSRGVSVLLSFRTRLPFDSLPEWETLRKEPLDRQKELLRDRSVRRRLVEAARVGPYPDTVGADARKPIYERMFVLERPTPPNPTVAELAARRGLDPVELIIELALATDMAQMFVQPLSPNAPEDLLAIMKHPRTIMTFSDSGAHVSQIMDSSIQTHLLSHWVRDRRAFTLEEAVRMLTLAPAISWGFNNRGLLREGCVADINIFDPIRIAPDMPTVVHDLPTGAPRISQKATGILATLVAGEVLVWNGEHSGALPGQLLRFH